MRATPFSGPHPRSSGRILARYRSAPRSDAPGPPRGRRTGVQAGDHGHRRRSRTPRTRHSEHKAPDRRQRVPVNRSNVDYTAGLASGAIHVHPRHVSDDGRPDGRRPPHVTAGRKLVSCGTRPDLHGPCGRFLWNGEGRITHGHTQHSPGSLGWGAEGKPGPRATDTQAAHTNSTDRRLWRSDLRQQGTGTGRGLKHFAAAVIQLWRGSCLKEL
jgi:hypothetical protein